MSIDGAPIRRELARTFLSALRPALDPSADEPTRFAAREAAQMLGLTGLDRALALLQALAGTTPPRDVTSITERIQRLAAESDFAGDTMPFEAADRELGELAGELEAFDWRDAATESDPEQPAFATLPLNRVFDESLLASEESRSLAARLRLSPPVAASLRAALDWLSPENLAAGSIRLCGEPSLLEVRLDSVQHRGIAAAQDVLAAVGGNLGPAVEEDAAAKGEWIVRVPSFAARPSYLMVIQGGLRVAIPWHAVLRLRMLSPAGMTDAKWRQGHPVLEFIATPSPNAIEYPIVCIAHGLKRGHFVADRLVWRLAAEPCENEWGSPALGLSETVRTEEGEIFWVADPGLLLQHVPVPEMAVREAPTPPPPLAARTPEPQATELRAPEPPIMTLTERDVEPLDLPMALNSEEVPSNIDVLETSSPAVTPVPELTIAPPAATHMKLPAAPSAPPRRRLALLADDSITARVFLTRQLFQDGVEVEAVATAADLLERLAGTPWDLIFVDADLPDGHGAAWLARAREAAATAAPNAHVVALVRDRADLDWAREAGIALTLIKPIHPEDLARLLAAVLGALE